jgi:membrane-associated progesterone receptor component
MPNSPDEVLAGSYTEGPIIDLPAIGRVLLPYISSPTNIVLFIILVYLTYVRLRPRGIPPPSVISDEPIVFMYYIPVELAEFDGRKNKRILMGVRGRVYDVSSGAHFYGPGGPYGNFAGRDASRGLSKGSFDDGTRDTGMELRVDMITPLDQPMDALADMTPEEAKALEDWEDHFRVPSRGDVC